MARRRRGEALPTADVADFASLHHTLQAGHLLSPTRESDDESGEDSKNEGMPLCLATAY